MAFNNFADFLALLHGVKPGGVNRFTAHCPSHDDNRNSLSVSLENDKILVKCHANTCSMEQIVAALGLQPKDLFLDTPAGKTFNKALEEVDKVYPYTDAKGKLIFEVVRYKPKNFRQRQPDGQGGYIWNLKGVKPTIYKLPAVLEAIRNKRAVFIVEGEKDADAAEALGCVATTSPMGAGKWHDDYSAFFHEANAIIIPDNDEPGQRHADFICQSLHAYGAASIRVLHLPGEGVKDLTDWVEKAGGTKDQLRELIGNLPPWTPGGCAAAEADLPEIDYSFARLRDATRQSLDALLAANNPPVLFIRTGQMVRINKDEQNLPLIETMNESAVRGRLERTANFVKHTSKGGTLPIAPPMEVVKDIMSLGSWPLQPLLGITETPVIRPDGSILNTPGYDPDTQLYYAPATRLRIPIVPPRPTAEQVQKAKELLLEIVCDFPFENEASRANCLAALMTPVLRPLINGPVPLVLFDAPQAGTGKSLLSDITAYIATGRTAAVMTAPSSTHDDDEWRKAITSLLILGRNVITIDNIEGRLSSASLASVLTSNTWQDRILGRTEMIIIPHRASWIGTGNNIRLGGDLPRRCYWVKIDAKNARPWQRGGFKHPRLMEWVGEMRGEIIVAMLTIARAWILAKEKPDPPDAPTIGSFEKWCSVLNSIMAFLQVPDFLGNLEKMYETVDEDTPQWEAFVEAWHQNLGQKYYTVAELVAHLKNHEVLRNSLPQDFTGALDDKNFTRKFGKALAKRADVVFLNKLSIQKGKTEQRALTWKVGEVQEGNNNSPNSPLDLKF